MGNPTAYKGRNLAWQGRRLISYGKDGKQATYTYDFNSVRTSKTATDGTTTVSSKYIYDGNTLIAEQRNGKWIYYLYGVDGIAGFKFEDKVYLYHKNVQGDITHIYKQCKDKLEVVTRYAYDAWGNTKILTETDGIGSLNPFRYRGYYYDCETKLYYLISRYYDPETGRFISADGIEYLDPETLGGLNLYAYCANNPIMAIDPKGTKTEWWQWLIAAVVAVAVVAAAVLTAGAIVAAAPAVATAASSMAYAVGASAAVASFVSSAVSVGATVLAISTIVVGVNEAIGILSGYNILSNAMGEDVYNVVRNTIGITSAVFVTAGMNLPYPSTGRSTPESLNEQVALNLLKNNPDKGNIISIIMKDPRMPAWLGWVKYQYTFNDQARTTIHYIGNKFFPSFLRPYFDFKFKG